LETGERAISCRLPAFILRLTTDMRPLRITWIAPHNPPVFDAKYAVGRQKM
jgi:hypothetical protein